MWVALVSIAVVFIPLSRLIPPLYVFRVRSRIFRWYRQLRQIEDRSEKKNASFPELIAELDRLDEKAARINVPLAYTDELYALRRDIDLVRARLSSGKLA
jgi:hypothetical protein